MYYVRLISPCVLHIQPPHSFLFVFISVIVNGSTSRCWILAVSLLVSYSYIQSVGLLAREISAMEGRYVHQRQHKQNNHLQTSSPREGFEPTISLFERAKEVHGLDRLATETGLLGLSTL
jgi:hypothetical protein